jgi:hypothetical protein
MDRFRARHPLLPSPIVVVRGLDVLTLAWSFVLVDAMITSARNNLEGPTLFMGADVSPQARFWLWATFKAASAVTVAWIAVGPAALGIAPDRLQLRSWTRSACRVTGAVVAVVILWVFVLWPSAKADTAEAHYLFEEPIVATSIVMQRLSGWRSSSTLLLVTADRLVNHTDMGAAAIPFIVIAALLHVLMFTKATTFLNVVTAHTCFHVIS